MSHNISVELNNNQQIYYCGSLVAGHITFNLFEDVTSAEEVVVVFEGKSKLWWTEHRNKQTHRYSNHEKYFKTEAKLLQNIPNNVLRQGQHRFPFQFMLPSNIPATFHFHSTGNAHVYYKIKGRVRRSGLHFDIKGKHEITLLGNTPVSACPTDPMAPAVGRDHKYICCCCCKQGPITGEINTNKMAYIPGETALITASIENLSKTDIGATRLNLKRVVKLKSTVKSRTFEDKPLSISYEGCLARRTLSLNNKEFQLPMAISPSELPFCGIIKPEYVIELEGVISGAHINLRVPATIFVASHALLPPMPAVNPTAPTTTDLPPSYASVDEPPVPAYNPTVPPASTIYNPPPAATTYNPPPAATSTTTGGTYYDWNNQPSAFTYN